MLVLLYIYINSTNIPPIMIINRIYENQNLLSLYVACFLPGRAKDLSAPLYVSFLEDKCSFKAAVCSVVSKCIIAQKEIRKLQNFEYSYD